MKKEKNGKNLRFKSTALITPWLPWVNMATVSIRDRFVSTGNPWVNRLLEWNCCVNSLLNAVGTIIRAMNEPKLPSPTHLRQGVHLNRVWMVEMLHEVCRIYLQSTHTHTQNPDCTDRKCVAPHLVSLSTDQKRKTAARANQIAPVHMLAHNLRDWGFLWTSSQVQPES